MIHYVAGFMFSPDLTQVVLIQKRKPEWQAGKLNAVGGKVEPGETALEAQIREFREETGVHYKGWTQFAVLEGPNERVDFFRAASYSYRDVRSTTNELVRVIPVASITAGHYYYVPNVPWLVRMANTICENDWPYKVKCG